MLNDIPQRFPAVPVRILSLLILTAGLASARPGILLAAGVMLLGAGLLVRRGESAARPLRILPLLRRVRWLLLAIVILYGWFMPGTPLLYELGALSPSVEGLQQGLLRVTALCGIVVAVYLLLATTPRGALVAGLLWFGRPLRRAGIDDRRFAVRLVLALEAVPQVQDLVNAALTHVSEGSRLQRIARAAANVLQTALLRAEQAHSVIDVPAPQPVPLWQWSVPAVFALILFAGAQL